MKRNFLKFLMISALLPLGSIPAVAGTQFGVSVSDRGLESFFLSIGQHYRAPREKVVYVHQQRIPDEEIPVVFLIAREARVAPETVVRLRRSGWTWVKIARYYRLQPTVFYVSGYHRTPYRHWNQVRFTDAEVVRLVNVRFISDYHRRPAAEIVSLRSNGKRFVEIDRDLGVHNRSVGKMSRSVRQVSKVPAPREAQPRRR
jgi:hypothetical protein